MEMTRRQGLVLLGSLPLAASAAAASNFNKVRVFEAARIITMEPSLPVGRFVATASGIILAVSDTLDGLAPWTHGREVELDRRFAGKVLLPGLIDPHIHPMQSAVMLNLPFVAPDEWDLPSGQYKGALTPDAYWAALQGELARSNDTPFICWGHHELFHGPLDRAKLDALAPDRPVIIWQRSFHEVIVNTAALTLWGLADKGAFDAAVAAVKADPAHADLSRGHFSETALAVALMKMQPVILAPEKIRKGMAALQQLMRQNGVTTTSDMATGIFASFEAEAGMIKAAFEHPGNPSRIMLMPAASRMEGVQDLDAWLNTVSRTFAGPHVRVDRRVKMLADGAFFALNMRMNPPGYLDGHQGKWITEPDALRAQFRRFWEAGFHLHIHVNGDEGLDVVLDELERLPVRNVQTITLEHLGYSTEAQNQRVARLGLMVSAQPNYIRVLGDAYGREGLGPGRAEVMNRLGSLERKGVPLGLHSDFNMAPIDPLYLAWIAANRVTLDGHVKAPQERLSLDKALRAITIEAAQVIGMDAMIGSIAAGKKADFTVLDRDPYKAGAAALRDIKVEGVVFEGDYSPAM